MKLARLLLTLMWIPQAAPASPGPEEAAAPAELQATTPAGDVPYTIDDSTKATAAPEDEFLRDLETELTAIAAQLDHLRREARHKVDELQRQTRHAEEKLDLLRRSGGEEWRRLRPELSEAMRSLRESFQHLQQDLSR